MVSISQIDGYLNSGRESLLSTMSKAPESAGIQSIFWVVAALMVIVLFTELRKGGEEKKGWMGPFAILVFCLSIIFGFSITVIGWIILIILSMSLLNKLREGEWKGVIMMLIPIYFIGYILSVKSYIFLMIAAFASLLGVLAKKANSERTYGTSDARKLQREKGYPEAKERKIIRALEKIANKGFGLSKDKVLLLQDKIRQRFARREAKNVETQEHEAAIAAAGEEIAETVDVLEEKEISLEQRNEGIMQEIERQCALMKQDIQGAAVPDAEKQKILMGTSKNILSLSNKLIKNQLEEETLKERANKLFERCMNIITHSANEVAQLRESRSAYVELKKLIDSNILTLRKEIDRTVKGLDKARRDVRASKAEEVHKEAKYLEQREGLLKDVEKKLSEIDGYIRQILNRLNTLNQREKAKMSAVTQIISKAKKHGNRLNSFQKDFNKQDAELRKEHKQFEHFFGEGSQEIPDEELVNVTNSTISMFATLQKITDISFEYEADELKKMVEEMTEVTRGISSLSMESEYLTKMYVYFSDALEKLTEMSQQVDQNAKSKDKMAKIIKTEQIEEVVTKRAYRKGKVIESHIRDGYKHLEHANQYLANHISKLDAFRGKIGNIKRDTGLTLNEAFKIMIKREIAQAKLLQDEAKKAEADLVRARRAETAAAHA